MNKKPGRNDPCPCGSGKKYKQCCLKKESTKTYTPAGKRKFKAKVIDSTANSQLFANSAGMPSESTDPDVMKALRFRMTDHDYSKDEGDSSTTEVKKVDAPKEKKEPTHKPGEAFETTNDDFQVDEK